MVLMHSNYIAVALYDKNNKYTMNSITAFLDKKMPREAVKVVNISKDSGFLSMISRLAEKTRLLLVVSSFMTIDVPRYMEIFERIREIKSNIVIIAGGPHPFGDPYGTLKNLGVDYVGLGDAELVLNDILSCIEDYGEIIPEYVKGLVYKDEDTICITSYPPPRLDNLDKSNPFPYWRSIFGPIELTRGCPYGCMYCETPFLHGSVMRHRSIENTLFWAQVFWRSGRRDLRFISPNSLSYGSQELQPNIEALQELLFGLKRVARDYKGRIFYGTFPSEVRPEFVTDETMRLLRDTVSNTRIIIGVQSGSNRVLRLINRGHTSEDVIRAVEIANKYGFTVDLDFILGLPGEKEEDMMDTIRFIQYLLDKGYRIRAHLHTFMPLPGSPFSDRDPGPVPERIKKEVFRLIGKGYAYGQWVQQEQYSKLIRMLREKDIIYPTSKSYMMLKKC